MMHDFDKCLRSVEVQLREALGRGGAYVMFVCGNGQDLPGWGGVLYGAMAARSRRVARRGRLSASRGGGGRLNLPATQFCTPQ